MFVFLKAENGKEDLLGFRGSGDGFKRQLLLNNGGGLNKVEQLSIKPKILFLVG